MPELSQLTNAIRAATNIDELLSIFKQFTKQPIDTDYYGITNEKIGLAKAKRLRAEANVKAIEIIKRVNGDASQLSEQDKADLRKYTGLGGIGESTNEYYTPQFVASGMWEGMAEMGFTGGNVLEPSAGAGVFSGTKPPATEMTAVELDETSGQVNQLLHPSDTVHITNFEKMAATSEPESYDHVIGNPPFGDRGSFGKDDPDYEHITVADKYFVERSINLCKAGGLIALALPPRVIDNKSWADWRKELSYQAEFLGAHMLPAGTFNANGTGTTVIVAFWRKHGKDVSEQLENTSEETLTKANVLWDSYISGKYFEKEGKKYVQGELEYKKGRHDSLETTAKGEVKPDAIRSKLAKPFHSRIDWSVLETAEPISAQYAEGDTRFINGRLKELRDGAWTVIDVEGQNGNLLDAEKYGAESLSELREKLKSPYALAGFDINQIKAIRANFPNYLRGRNKAIVELTLKQKDKYQRQVMRGAMIGAMIDVYRTMRQQGRDDHAMRDEIVNLAQKEFLHYGHPHKRKALLGLTGKDSHYWNDFAAALDKEGNQSAFLAGEVETVDNATYDESDPADVINHLYTRIGSREITIEDVNEFSDKPVTLEDVIKLEGVSLDPNGMLVPTQQYCSGDVVSKRDALMSAIGKAARKGKRKNAHLIDAWQKQIEIIDEKRAANWQSLDDIKVSLNAPWIDKSLIIEFLHDNGYTRFRDDAKPKDIEDNKTGAVWGYRFDESGKSIKRPEEAFERHLENYLNSNSIDIKKDAKAVVMKDIHALDAEFSDWLQAHHDTAGIEKQYNDRFNRFVEFEHSSTDLELTNISGEITLMGYQNTAIRRMAEDGRGLLGFQMGLGKTFSALGLVAYNLQTKRFKRTCIVVPKSTYENWYHEHTAFFGHQNQKGTLFVGIEPETEDGQIKQTPILDKDGEPTGKMRDVVRELDGKEIAARMALIPHSDFQMVVMTKEQFARIPMRPDTKEQYVDKMVANQNIRSTRLAVETIVGKDRELATGGGYQAAKRQAGFKRKYSNEGTQKEGAYPFYEDMAFDNVVVDEAHNYRNSYQAGREAGKLAWLPTQGSAKTSLDMALKLDHIRAQNDGKGTFLLTATPNVNSPTDMFNMLSLVIGADEWMKYNIANVDDFIRVFGETEMRDVERLSGEIEPQEALVGFKNLRGLQNLFHKWSNVKDADDVGADVEIPDMDTRDAETPMTNEQQAIYEELRAQAKELSEASTDEEREELRAKGITTFGIIRRMDKIATDPDLYHGTITYHFNADDKDKVDALVSKLPKSLKVTDSDDDKEVDLGDGEKEEKVSFSHNAQVSIEGDKCVLVVNAHYEDKVNAALKRNKIDESTVTHPITPKYARLIENVKAGLVDGKQIIFTEEKTQHRKLQRILCYHLGIKSTQIGIINADEILKNQGEEGDELAGLEAIAADYNEGRKKIIIANKKAEVGINLHKGTSDIHHLTIPWTPASLRQRNGRGARVGSTHKSVRCWIYQATGSFDKFRYETMQRKANWINEVLTTTSNTAANANADDAAYANDLLAENEQVRQQQRAERQAEAERKQRLEAEKRASKQLELYLKSGHIAAVDIDDINQQLNSLNHKIEQELPDLKRYGSNTNNYKETVVNLRNLRDKKRRYERLLKAHPAAADQVKRLRGRIKRYVDDGVLNVDRDVIDKPESFVNYKGKVIKIGETWRVRGSRYEGTDNNINTVDRSDLLVHEMIVRVAAHNETLGAAKCYVLWPETVKSYKGYSGKRMLNSDSQGTSIFYDSFMYKESFDKSEIAEQNLVHTLTGGGKVDYISTEATNEEGHRDSIKFTKITVADAELLMQEIGATRFREIMAEHNGMVDNNIQATSSFGSDKNYEGAIYYKDGEISLVEKSYERRAEMEPYYLLEPMLNDEIKRKLGLFVLKHLKDKERLESQGIAELSVPSAQLRHLMGAQWFDNLESWGNSIPTEDLAAFAQEAIIKVRKDFDFSQACRDSYEVERKANWGSDHNAAQRVNTQFSDKVKAEYYSQIDGDYDNVREQAEVIKSAISDLNLYKTTEALYKEEKEKVIAEEAAQHKAKQDTWNDIYSGWMEGGSRLESKQRLDALYEFAAKFPTRSVVMVKAADIYQLMTNEEAESKDIHREHEFLLKVAADLSHYDGFEKLDVYSAIWNTQAINQYDRWKRAVAEGNNPTDEPEPEQQAEIDAPICDSDVEVTGALADMIVRINQNEIVLDERKRKVRGRWKTDKAVRIPAKAKIGIQDPEGFKGQLSALFKGRDNPVKAKYEAEWFSRDDAPELAGGFWLVPASTDLQALATEFETL